MKRGTHNLGRNRFGELGLVRIEDEQVLLLVGKGKLVLSHEQAQLLKDVL